MEGQSVLSQASTRHRERWIPTRGTIAKPPLYLWMSAPSGKVGVAFRLARGAQALKSRLPPRACRSRERNGWTECPRMNASDVLRRQWTAGKVGCCRPLHNLHYRTVYLPLGIAGVVETAAEG